MQTIITNIKQLLQVRETPITKVSGAEMSHLPMLENAFLVGLGEAKVQEMQEMMQNTLARLQRADAPQ